ncbi:MAG: aminoglycoside phosphotransferase family protein [Microlunatus sp.]
MSVDPSEQALADLVSDAVGSARIELVRVPGSVANLDYLVRTADQRRFIVKVGPRSEMVAEAWACRRLADTEVPVPEIVHLELDHSATDRATLIVSFVPGTASDDLLTFEAAGRAMRRAHAEHLSGWGPIVADVDGSETEPRGRFDSWGAYVLDDLSGLPELVSAGIVDAQLATVARDCVLVDEVLGYSGPGALLHNDLKPAHLFALDEGEGQRLSAIIDWGDASVGDPLVDLARLSMSGAGALQAFSVGYGIDLTPVLHRRLARYRILHNVGALTYEYRAGGDWFDVYRNRVSQDVELLTE